MRTLSTLFLVATLGSCTYQELADTCAFRSKAPLYETEASALRMLIAWPISADRSDPILSLYDDQDEPSIAVGLKEIESDPAAEIGAAMPNCGKAKMREYWLVIDEADWKSYWQKAKESGQFSGGVAMPGVDPIVRRDSIGFGLADKQSGEFYWACGCLSDSPFH